MQGLYDVLMCLSVPGMRCDVHERRNAEQRPGLPHAIVQGGHIYKTKSSEERAHAIDSVYKKTRGKETQAIKAQAEQELADLTKEIAAEGPNVGARDRSSFQSRARDS